MRGLILQEECPSHHILTSLLAASSRRSVEVRRRTEERNVNAMFGHHPWTVQELVNGVASGTVRLPDIQRPFVWSNSKVRDLIDSMYRGYPVGELMFWANRDSGYVRTIRADPKSQRATMQVVDGSR